MFKQQRLSKQSFQTHTYSRYCSKSSFHSADISMQHMHGPVSLISLSLFVGLVLTHLCAEQVWRGMK